MKKLHLLCNAHLDPVWLWKKNEGIAEAISTFRVAADFCEEYDGFVFNHNEALLYEWVETHEPELFERIKRLVKEGKWIIMGGWYLQPDCVMTSGESLLSQIELGREYFQEKFGVIPTTAINFDPFGHTRGLVQILKSQGYDNYIFMRPQSLKGNFIWKGFDGSQIIAHGIFGGYNTLKGKAAEKIQRCLDTESADVGLCLWGIGNHGGGPSRIDLDNISALMKQSNTEIVHSSAENYFAEIDTSNLPVVETSLGPCMVGCYTSMVQIKQANRRLENKIAVTEKIIAHAEHTTNYKADLQELKKAKKALAFCQFHDILPGSSIKPVEEESLKTFAYAEEIVDNLFTEAFLKLCAGQKKAKAGEIPILVYNPHPYEITREFEVGFMRENQNWNENEVTLAQVYDENGHELPTQNEKPDCTFNLDWIQKVSFTATLAPCSLGRFDCKLTTVTKDMLPQVSTFDDCITVRNDKMQVTISKKTGLIAQYIVDGKMLVENGGALQVYQDNEDPWGMTVDRFTSLEGYFAPMSDKEAAAYIGYPDENLPNVRIIEEGIVRTKVQALFTYNRSTAVVEYTIPKNSSYVDVHITLNFNEANKMVKYVLNSPLHGTPWGETAFGCQVLPSDEQETVFHKWCGIRTESDHLYVVNSGTYGGSFTGNSMKLSLLRTPIYAAHPIAKRQIAPHNRFIDHIDMGQREFSFRLTAEENIQREAQLYNEAPYLLSFFPSGEGNKPQDFIRIDNPHIILSSVRKKDGVWVLTLHNASDEETDATITVISDGTAYPLHFGKFELKTMSLSPKS